MGFEDISGYRLRHWFRLATVLLLSFYALGFFRTQFAYEIYGSLTVFKLLGFCGLAVWGMLWRQYI